MITFLTFDKNKARSLRDMQQIAGNQIRLKATELRERATKLDALLPQVENITDWDSYSRIIDEVEYYGDDIDLTALKALAENYEAMKAGPGGGYF